MIEVTGHRGAAGLTPENTLSGFRLAAELGCNAVELDIQLTKDGKLAVIHDEILGRTVSGNGYVSDYTMAELKAFDAGNGEEIPSIDEVFDLLLKTELRIQIELKGQDTERQIADIVRKRDILDRVAFTSFHHKRVFRIRELLPEATTGILITCNPVDPAVLLDSTRADNLHVQWQRIDRELIEQVRESGHKIIAWGKIVEAAVADHLIGLGVDIIGSDRPDIVIERVRLSEKSHT